MIGILVKIQKQILHFDCPYLLKFEHHGYAQTKAKL